MPTGVSKEVPGDTCAAPSSIQTQLGLAAPAQCISCHWGLEQEGGGPDVPCGRATSPATTWSPAKDSPERPLALAVFSIPRVNASPVAFDFLLLFFPYYIIFHLQNL